MQRYIAVEETAEPKTKRTKRAGTPKSIRRERINEMKPATSRIVNKIRRKIKETKLNTIVRPPDLASMLKNGEGKSKDEILREYKAQKELYEIITKQRKMDRHTQPSQAPIAHIPSRPVPPQAPGVAQAQGQAPAQVQAQAQQAQAQRRRVGRQQQAVTGTSTSTGRCTLTSTSRSRAKNAGTRPCTSTDKHSEVDFAMVYHTANSRGCCNCINTAALPRKSFSSAYMGSRKWCVKKR